jgi:hypothetical protein
VRPKRETCILHSGIEHEQWLELQQKNIPVFSAILKVKPKPRQHSPTGVHAKKMIPVCWVAYVQSPPSAIKQQNIV